MMYIPVTYVPDGPVTAALKRRVKGHKPKPKLGNLGPLLDENLNAARKRGCFLYHPDDLRLLKGVKENPDVVVDGFLALSEVLDAKGIAKPDVWDRSVPYYPDVRKIAVRTAVLALLMTIGITVAVLLGQEDAIAWMTAAIVAISIIGATVFGLIVSRTVIHVDVPA